MIGNRAIISAIVAAAASNGLGQAGGYPHFSFLPQTQQDIQGLVFNNASLITSFGVDGGLAFQVQLNGQKSSVKTLYQNANDWSAYDGVELTILNNGSTPMNLSVRTDTQRPHGQSAGAQFANLSLGVGDSRNYVYWFDQSQGQYGFRQSVAYFPYMYQWLPCSNFNSNLQTIYQWTILNLGSAPALFTVTKMQLVNKRPDLAGTIDPYGQWGPLGWAGKPRNDVDLLTQVQIERALLLTEPVLASVTGTTQFGNMGATGKWHLGKSAAGSWYFVHPNGNAFWSMGIDAVGAGDPTVTDGRAPLYQRMPPANENWGSPYAYMKELDGTWANTVNFHQANLQVKFAATWATDFQNLTFNRLPKWGFNTIGAFSDPGFCGPQMPFITLLSTSAFPTRLVVPQSQWGPLPDPFDASFTPWMVTQFAPRVAQYNGQTNFIGVCVDNELGWCSRHASYFQIATATLNSDPSQPAKAAFIAQLESEYGSIGQLNAAWQTSYASWAALNSLNGYGAPNMNGAMTADFSAFLTSFATKYFSSVRSALSQVNLSGLYLGSRDLWESTPDEMLQVEDLFVDVHTLNIYLDLDSVYAALSKFAKPTLIGEYASSALDHGLCCFANPVETGTQADRVAFFETYVKRALACPNIIGAHLYAYIDNPRSGRYFDNQTWGNGIVDICDIPYSDVVAEFQSIAPSIYTLHH